MTNSRDCEAVSCCFAEKYGGEIKRDQDEQRGFGKGQKELNIKVAKQGWPDVMPSGSAKLQTLKCRLQRVCRVDGERGRLTPTKGTVLYGVEVWKLDRTL
jgi:hypothetical protein